MTCLSRREHSISNSQNGSKKKYEFQEYVPSSENLKIRRSLYHLSHQ